MGYLGDIYAARGKVLPERSSPFIIGDKAPYFSPLDRTTVSGRTAHREHMTRHGVVEAGDMKLGSTNTDKPMDAVRPDIQRAMQELNR